jgi:hypothetical protein
VAPRLPFRTIAGLRKATDEVPGADLAAPLAAGS